MKSLFALFVSLALIGIMFYPGGQPRQLRLNEQRTNWCVIENEHYAFWDKRFDRYASYWLGTFSDELPEEIRRIDHLQTHQTRSGAELDQHKTKSEADTLWTSQAQASLRSYRGDRPKVSKPKE